MVQAIHEDSVGTTFRQRCRENNAALDLTGASLLQFRFRKPDGTRFDRTATLDGVATLGVIIYVGQTGEFETPGDWCYQAHVTIPSGEWWGDVADFVILPNLAAP